MRHVYISSEILHQLGRECRRVWEIARDGRVRSHERGVDELRTRVEEEEDTEEDTEENTDTEEERR